MTRRELLGLLGAAPALPAMLRAPGPADPVEQIRDLVPQLRSSSCAYLDSAATTLRPRPVLDAMAEFYERHNANPAHRLHSLAERAMREYEGARAQVASFLHAQDPLEVVFTRGTTEALNLVASAWGEKNLGPGDEVLLTVAEHASHMLPWQLVAQKKGAVVRYAGVDEEGRIRISDVEALLSKRTRLVGFTHVSNVAGAVNPARQICAVSRKAGARVLIDSAQAVPHFGVDVGELGADFVAFSSHKMLGPMGAGVLWARREVLDAMPPYQAGANMAHASSLTEWHYAPGAQRFGAGTPSVADAVGLAAATRLLTSLGRERLWQREQELARYAARRLREVRGLRILGPANGEGRISVFTFVIDGLDPVGIVRALDRRGICIRGGDLASMPLLQRFGVQSAARASLYLYTTTAEVDRLVEALRELAEQDG